MTGTGAPRPTTIPHRNRSESVIDQEWRSMPRAGYGRRMPQPVLDIVALRSLTAIADHGGFHRAAQVLALSQSAVSQHVRRLEKTLGRPVVEREGRGTRFTPEGRLLLEQARRVLAVHDEAVRTLLDVDGDTITLGSTEHAADRFLPLLTAAVEAVRPGCRVRFRIDRSARLVEAVERGSVDVAVYVTEAAATEGTLARTGRGVALLATVGPAPDGLTPYEGLPPVPPIPMSALARPGADPATVEAAFAAVRQLLT
jgi:molybdate transport repressor ModE-like protein